MLNITALRNFLLVLLVWVGISARSQELTQTIKGTVFDKQSQSPLPFANLIVTGTDPVIATTTDEQGYFRLENVPIGRHTLQITFLGYESAVIPNVLVNSSKEVDLEIFLEEKVNKMDEVVISGGRRKEQAINEVAVISARTVSMDEAKRYSGTRQDPSRMAQNFAGVSNVNDERNDIVIRGNSPTGLLWRMEGIDIPSPNHYATLGTTGGPVTMLNTNNLKDSDFMTSAFPAEYGNAVAGVFDLNLRNPNREKFEFLGQIGFNGFELGAEGPLSKKKKASFFVNYRYSVLAIMKALGAELGTGSAVPEYQDVNFKIDIPTDSAGKFSLFGLGGISSIEFSDSQSDEVDLYNNEGEDLRAGTKTGIIGLSHTYFFSQKTYQKIIFATSAVYSTFENDSLSRDSIDRIPIRVGEASNLQLKYSLGYRINHKFNAKNKIYAGITEELYDFNLLQKNLVADVYRTTADFDGLSSLSQSFITWQHRFSDKVTLNLGIHNQYFSLNHSFMAEPRLGVRYEFRAAQSLNFGVGLHSQMQPLPVYFTQTLQKDSTIAETNLDLGFTRSLHAVAGYDNLIWKYFRIKIEGYTQYITNAPVEQQPSSFSVLNYGADFGFPLNDSLVNDGIGLNYGVEITLEKFLHKGYYILFTGSLFQSKYKGSDDVWRNTAFNSNYVFNLLGGKEWTFKKGHSLGFDIKLAFAGGRRYTEIDLAASSATGGEVRKNNEAYAARYRPYFRPDIKIHYSLQKRRATQRFSVDLQNFVDYDNVFQITYNSRTGEIQEINQLGFFPNLTYQVLF